MGKRGRAPKPTNLRVLEGGHPERINRNEPTPHEDAIVPPVELDEKASEVWNRLSPDLIAKRVLTAWDVEAFATYCQSVSTYTEARRHLNEEGLTARGAAGGVIKSPYWQIMRDAADLMIKYGGRFGLTPSDRAQLSIEQPEQRGKDASRLLG